MRRPFGISILATLNYISVGLCVLAGVMLLIAPRVLASISVFLDPSTPASNVLSSITDNRPVGLFFLLIGGLIYYFVARGLWNLRSWARSFILFFSILNLVDGRDAPRYLLVLPQRLLQAIWPHSHLLNSGLLPGLFSRVLSLVLILYLLTLPVKTAFQARPTEWRWLLAVSACTLLWLGYSLYNSGPELRAICWHHRHGDQVSINGVTFPIYFWYAPAVDSDCQEFSVDDRPGPLRPNRHDYFTDMRVLGYKESDPDLTAQQRLDKEVASYSKSGYHEVTKFQLQVAGQTLDCFKPYPQDHILFCYGDGPIFHIYFAGDESAYYRFNHMLAAAH